MAAPRILPAALYKACADLGRTLPPNQAAALALKLADHESRKWAEPVVHTFPTPAFRTVAQQLLHAWDKHPDVPGPLLGSALAGSAYAHDLARTEPEVSIVMTGPSTTAMKSLTTEQTLIDLVHKAQTELVLVTYNFSPYPELAAELKAASARGVSILVLCEDPQDNKNFDGTVPAIFKELKGVRLRWPADQRKGHAAIHAKLAIADAREAFITSANLSWTASNDSIEAGVRIVGGDIPRRLRDHIMDLRTGGSLIVA